MPQKKIERRKSMDKKYAVSVLFIIIACLLWVAGAHFLLPDAGLGEWILYLVQAVMFYILGATVTELNMGKSKKKKNDAEKRN